jgi:hypothetical protein|tara:strand:+ start:212 stop:577 length:366 start_codon:yes stop_codon:yes gene_type:complete
MGTGKLKNAPRNVQKAAFATKADGGKGHPDKQLDIDSLATNAYNETFLKHKKAKDSALADLKERQKHDATRPKPVAVNDSTGTAPVLPKPVAKPTFKEKVKSYIKMFAKGAGYNPEHLKDL